MTVAAVKGGRGEKQGCICSWKVTWEAGDLLYVSSEQKGPSLTVLSSWGQVIGGISLHHLLSKQQKGSCKSHWKCKNAYSYPENLVPGKQLKGNSILGYGLHE